jgi:uncharacterized lipoprotein YddW (UPF0748 family)
VAADSGYPAAVVYGSECYGPSFGIHIWKRSGGEMTYTGDVPMPSDVGGVPIAAVAYEPENDGLIFALTCSTGDLPDVPSRILAINAKTFQEEGRYDIALPDAVYERGSLVLDQPARKLYWYGRGPLSTDNIPQGSWGCLSYTVPPVRPDPTPGGSPTPTPLTTPTPTPEPTPIPNPDEEIRALWVTRWDYATTSDIQTIVANAATHHFNVLLFQVRGNATSFYRSTIEPWAWELTSDSPATTGQDPGWDPLQVAMEESHKAGIQIHAWMNVYPGWRGLENPPPGSSQVWITHKDWFCRDFEGNLMMPSASWYTLLSPGHPDVQDYLNSVFLEIVDAYPELDGVHYDYIRYPYEVGDWEWNPVDVATFTAEAGGTPQDKPAEWAQWKTDQITALVQRNYQDGARLRPGVAWSAAVLGDYSGGVTRGHQDSHAWMIQGIIDAIMPMLYTETLDTFILRVQGHLRESNGRFVAPGIYVSTYGTQGLLDRIAESRRLGAQGVTLFAYSILFPDHTPGSFADALLGGPFSNVASVPPMPWKEAALSAGWLLW